VNGACAQKPVSGPCTSDDDCREGAAYCDGSSCQLLKADGAGCASNDECQSGSCDASTGKCVERATLCHEP
jgi:hypothetical protein